MWRSRRACRAWRYVVWTAPRVSPPPSNPAQDAGRALLSALCSSLVQGRAPRSPGPSGAVTRHRPRSQLTFDPPECLTREPSLDTRRPTRGHAATRSTKKISMPTCAPARHDSHGVHVSSGLSLLPDGVDGAPLDERGHPLDERGDPLDERELPLDERGLPLDERGRDRDELGRDRDEVWSSSLRKVTGAEFHTANRFDAKGSSVPNARNRSHQSRMPFSLLLQHMMKASSDRLSFAQRSHIRTSLAWKAEKMHG